ncbi:DUF305 domain-containing protein [Bacteroides sp.]|uniref:DUF305 domain-containing protein n=1 Tax=Bacteroides sp. TaxID=29523 RepID=UPI002601DA1F|nr:DUF305 domain-containing protein [Bacteroides sp.]
MKQKIKLLLAIATMFSITSFAYSQDVGCKCGNQCKCGEKNGTGMCKCGVGCQCAQMHSHSMQMTHNNVFLIMMDSMMTAMDAAPLDASAEGNFLRQMIPHHQGAIEMAKYEIANGKNKQMIQLAKSILTEQQGEIQEMKAMLALYPFVHNQVPSADYKKSMDDAMMKMMTATPSDKDLQGKSVDCAFAMVMLPHHQAAVDMSTALLKLVPTGQVATYAARIISDQQIEIQQMAEFIKQNCKE